MGAVDQRLKRALPSWKDGVEIEDEEPSDSKHEEALNNRAIEVLKRDAEITTEHFKDKHPKAEIHKHHTYAHMDNGTTVITENCAVCSKEFGSVVTPTELIVKMSRNNEGLSKGPQAAGKKSPEYIS